MALPPRYVGGDWLPVVPGGRHRFRAIAIVGLYIAGGWLLPGRKRVVPYSIQTLKRLKPALFRQDLIALFDLLQPKKIKPLIAQRFPLIQSSPTHWFERTTTIAGKINNGQSGSSRQNRVVPLPTGGRYWVLDQRQAGSNGMPTK
jgi:hypothetical protein